MRAWWGGLALLMAVMPALAEDAPGAAPDNAMVDVELVLLVDVSASIDDDQYGLQKQGYVRAFQGGDMVEAIRRGLHGRIAVTYVEWDRTPRQMTGWHLIEDEATSRRFADAITGTTRHKTGGTTGIAAAILATPALFETNSYKGLRRIVDISGDGAENTGADAAAARDTALAAGVSAINGIVVTDKDGPREFYQEDVIGGGRSFLLVVRDFTEFEDAIRRKLVMEIAAR